MTKIIFFGTPDYVIPVLEGLWKNFKLVAVVTQPPKVTGRGQKFRAFSPVDNWAHKHKIKILHDLKPGEFPEADLGVVASYGRIIPQSVIDYFPNGMLNVHPSLLPKYRGASPVPAAIMAGETETGVTIIKMDAQMDHGPIVSQFKEEIQPTDNSENLRKRLFGRSAQFLVDLIPNYISKKIMPKDQNHEKATFTKLASKEDGFIEIGDFKKPEKADQIDRKIRALTPWPGVWTKLPDGKRLKILKPKLEEVQLEGKNSVKWTQFVAAYPEFARLF